MASDGSHGPKPWKQRRATTLFLRCPAADYELVRVGAKTEFRGARGASSAFFHVKPPCPVVLYTLRGGEYDHCLKILTETWQEPLGAISEESLEREGYPDLASFRRYWIERERHRFQMTRLVWAYRIEPWDPARMPELGEAMIRSLYRDFLEFGE